MASNDTTTYRLDSWDLFEAAMTEAFKVDQQQEHDILKKITTPERRILKIAVASMHAAANARIESHKQTNEGLHSTIERLNTQLAGCGAAALGYGQECKPGDQAWSSSMEQVQQLRTRYRETHNALAQATELLEYIHSACTPIDNDAKVIMSRMPGTIDRCRRSLDTHKQPGKEAPDGR